MQLTGNLKKRLMTMYETDTSFPTHAVVSADEASEDGYKIEGFKGYCAAQARTADLALEDVTDVQIVNLVTL